MRRLEGKRCVVTAAGQGIGRATAERFAAEGALVFATDVNAEALDALERIETAVLDVTDKAALEGWVQASAEKLGGIDIVVANVSALAMEDDEEGWRKQYETDMLHTSERQMAERSGRSVGEELEAIACSNAQGRLVQPQEVAVLVAFCCSDAAAGLTMEDIQVNAGALW